MAYHFAFPLPDALTQKTFHVIATLREAPHLKANRKALIDLVNELADVGLAHFFVKSLKDAGINFLKIKAAEVGLQTFKNGLKPILRSMVYGMNDKQILKIIDFMETVMVDDQIDEDM